MKHISILYYIDHSEIAIVEIGYCEFGMNCFCWVLYNKFTEKLYKFHFVSKTKLKLHSNIIKKGMLMEIFKSKAFSIEIDDRLLHFKQKKPESLPEDVKKGIEKQITRIFNLN